jgi:hypothetical protein
MKNFRSNTGPFAEKPFFTAKEMEDTCIRELHMQGLLPSCPEPIRIDRFVEKRFGIQPLYEDLPRGLLGFTVFGPTGVEQIVVSKSFDEEGTTVAERRLRTTLAHESGHGLIHAHLFALASETIRLFGEDVSDNGTKMLCRDEAEGVGAARKGKYRWWEYQANQIMGGLLLPKPLVDKALDPLYVPQGRLGGRIIAPDRAEEAARMLAETFDVNPVVARIRLKTLSTISDPRQLTL